MTSLFPLLPVFLDLTGRAAVLLSAEAGLAPLARRLLDSGAGVTVIDPEPSPAVAALIPSVRIIARRWRSSDLVGAALVVAGSAERRPARAKAAARSVRALFLTHGDPALSDILLGSAVARGPLAIGVTATGIAPAVGDAIARRFEAAVPQGYGRFLEAAARAVGRLEGAIPDSSQRDAFWQAAAESAFEGAQSAEVEDWDGWIAARIPSVSA